MELGETTLLALLIILFLGLVIPELFRKSRVPFIITIIFAGAVVGPKGLGYVNVNEIISFFGFLGMNFLMLMAGLQTDISKLKKSKKKIMIMSLMNGLIPFITGFLIVKYFGYSLEASLLVGIIFISSSVAIIVPTLKSAEIYGKDFGQLVISSVLITDIVSLIALGIVLQSNFPIINLPFHFYLMVLLMSIICLFLLIPRVSNKILKLLKKDNGYEKGLRFILILLFSIIVYFSIIGVHPILASFLVGLVLAGPLKTNHAENIYNKIHILGYGLFVPIFFFIVGMEMDLKLFRDFDASNIIMISLILGIILSKLISGFVAGKIVKLKNKEAYIFGAISIAQLTTTLAVTYTASNLNILDNTLTTSIILLSIITTFLGPLLVSYSVKK